MTQSNGFRCSSCSSDVIHKSGGVGLQYISNVAVSRNDEVEPSATEGRQTETL